MGKKTPRQRVARQQRAARSRSRAAAKGWATRKAREEHARRSRAAKLGWERRKAREAKRSRAARKGHATRRESKLARKRSPGAFVRRILWKVYRGLPLAWYAGATFHPPRRVRMASGGFDRFLRVTFDPHIVAGKLATTNACNAIAVEVTRIALRMAGGKGWFGPAKRGERKPSSHAPAEVYWWHTLRMVHPELVRIGDNPDSAVPSILRTSDPANVRSTMHTDDVIGVSNQSTFRDLTIAASSTEGFLAACDERYASRGSHCFELRFYGAALPESWFRGWQKHAPKSPHWDGGKKS